MKISKNHSSASFVQVSVSSPVPLLRKDFTLRVLSTLSRLNKLGKLPDFPDFHVVCQEQPRQSEANTDADCDKYCTRNQDYEQFVER